MRPLSLDLRERIVAAYEANEVSKAEIGRRFLVTGAVVGKLVRQKQKLGTLEPQTHRCGRKPAISGETLEKLRLHLKEHPDATLAERIETLSLKCSQKTLWQTLRKIGWRFKKNRRARPSKTGATSF